MPDHDIESTEYLARLDERVKTLNARLDKIEPQLALIISYIDRQRGGWAMLMLICAAAGAVGAFVSKFISAYVASPLK